jgi:hypothetical protein
VSSRAFEALIIPIIFPGVRSCIMITTPRGDDYLNQMSTKMNAAGQPIVRCISMVMVCQVCQDKTAKQRDLREDARIRREELQARELRAASAQHQGSNHEANLMRNRHVAAAEKADAQAVAIEEAERDRVCPHKWMTLPPWQGQNARDDAARLSTDMDLMRQEQLGMVVGLGGGCFHAADISHLRRSTPFTPSFAGGVIGNIFTAVDPAGGDGGPSDFAIVSLIQMNPTAAGPGAVVIVGMDSVSMQQRGSAEVMRGALDGHLCKLTSHWWLQGAQIHLAVERNMGCMYVDALNNVGRKYGVKIVRAGGGGSGTTPAREGLLTDHNTKVYSVKAAYDLLHSRRLHVMSGVITSYPGGEKAIREVLCGELHNWRGTLTKQAASGGIVSHRTGGMSYSGKAGGKKDDVSMTTLMGIYILGLATEARGRVIFAGRLQ